MLANCQGLPGNPAMLPDDRRGVHDLTRRPLQVGHLRIAHLTLHRALPARRLRTESPAPLWPRLGGHRCAELGEPCVMRNPGAGSIFRLARSGS